MLCTSCSCNAHARTHTHAHARTHAHTHTHTHTCTYIRNDCVGNEGLDAAVLALLLRVFDLTLEWVGVRLPHGPATVARVLKEGVGRGGERRGDGGNERSKYTVSCNSNKESDTSQLYNTSTLTINADSSSKGIIPSLSLPLTTMRIFSDSSIGAPFFTTEADAPKT